jgi:hypothetical protein
MIKLFSILILTIVGSLSAITSSSAEETTSQAESTILGPESCVVYGGKAHCYDDGSNCVYHVEANFSHGSDCGPNTME